MTPLRTMLVLSILIIIVMLTAGCPIGDCPYDFHTSIITKISENGTHEWTKELNNGFEDLIIDALPISDGGLIASGSIIASHSGCSFTRNPRIIRFSSTGEILWDKIFEKETGWATTILQNRNGNYLVIFNNQKIYLSDQKGNLLQDKIRGESPTILSDKVYRGDIVETKDYGFFISNGRNLTKLDDNGNILWQRQFATDTDNNNLLIIQLKNDQGPYLASYTQVRENITISRLDNEGNILNLTILAPDAEVMHYPVYIIPQGYLVLYENVTPGLVNVAQFDHQGVFIFTQTLNGTLPMIPTNDGGYFSATRGKNIPYEGMGEDNLHVVKLNRDGSEDWNKSFIYVNPEVVRRIIQSPDGGYFIISLKRHFVDLSE